MVKINIKGPIISNDDAWIYRFFGWDYAAPKALNDALEQASGEDVELEINSPGGYVSCGYEMYADIMNYPGKVTAHVICAASAATLLLCAANEVLISDAGYIMIHNASVSASGNKNTMQQTHDRLQAIDDGIINAYIRKTGKEKEELQQLMDDETYMAPERAIELGFADGYLFGAPGEKPKDTDVQQFVASEIQLIPEDRIKELAIAMEKSKVAPVQPVATSQQNDKQNPANAVSDKKNKEEENMTLAELAKEHPEIQEEINSLMDENRKAGADEERARIQSLDAIAKTVTPEALNEAKYGEEKKDGKTLAFEAMVKGERIASAYLSDAKDDSQDSGAEDVGIGKPDDEGASESDQMAAHVNAKKGV